MRNVSDEVIATLRGVDLTLLRRQIALANQAVDVMYEKCIFSKEDADDLQGMVDFVGELSRTLEAANPANSRSD